MKIKESDVTVLWGSVQIEKLNRKRTVEELYSLYEDMSILGWGVEVDDFEYMNYFTAQLWDSTNTRVLNSQEDKKKFIKDLVNCINKTLNK